MTAEQVLDLAGIEKRKKRFWSSPQVAEIIPVRWHYTKSIVHLRGGKLAAALKIEGLNFSTMSDQQRIIYRNQFADLMRNISTPNLTAYAIYAKRLGDYELKGKSDYEFSNYVRKGYEEKLEKEVMYSSHYYLVFVYQAETKIPFFGSKKQEKIAEENLLSGIELLNNTMSLCAEAMSAWSPRVLETIDRKGRLYSEVAELYSQLLNVEEIPVPMGPYSLAEAVAVSRPVWGFETGELRHPDHSYNFATLSIKEYMGETYPEMWASLLDLPCIFNFVQSFTFESRDSVMSKMKLQRIRYENSGDEARSLLAQIDEALDEVASGRLVGGMHNTALTVFSADEGLQKDLSLCRNALSASGAIVVREDMGFPSQYMSSFPGNEAQRVRSALITSSNFADMAPFYNYPTGQKDGNCWGEALTVFRTQSNTPYYFSLHEHDVGHTLITGMTGAGKTALQTFLLANAARSDINPKIVVFDKDRGMEIFIRAMGGEYITLEPGKPTGFNPFSRPLDERHRQFLNDFVQMLGGGDYKADVVQDIDRAIQGVYELPEDQRRLSALVVYINRDSSIYLDLQTWINGGPYAWAFDNKEDTLSIGKFWGMDMTHVLDTPKIRTPIISYLFEVIDQLFDGDPVVLNLEEYWKLLDDDYFKVRIKDWLKTLRKRNGIVIAATQSPQDALKSDISATVIEQAPTKIFLANEDANKDDYLEGFRFSPGEWQAFSSLPKSARKFMLKQGSDSVFLNFNLNGMNKALAVLSTGDKDLNLLEQVKTEHGNELPQNWLDKYFEKKGITNEK